MSLARWFVSFFLVFNAQLVSAQQDNIPMSVWVNEAIVATYTFDYQNFLTQQKEVAKYFTAEGWINFIKALNNSKLPENVQKNQYSVNAVALMPPVINEFAPRQWQAKMPILVVYKNVQLQQKQTLEIIIHFTVAPRGQGVRGFAINSFQSEVINPPCECKTESTKINKSS